MSNNTLKYVIFLYFLMNAIFSFGQAKWNEAEARSQYALSRKLYEEKKYLQCFNSCKLMVEKMGKDTKKVQWLLVNAGVRSFSISKEANEEVTKSELQKMNYLNLLNLQAEIKKMMAFAGNSDKNETWFLTILEWNTLITKLLKKYEYQNNRTPQSAIDFLNDCANRFSKVTEVASSFYPLSYTFSLQNFNLVVKMNADISYPIGRKWRQVNAAGILHIPLKEVKIEKQVAHRLKNEINFIYPFHTARENISSSRLSQIATDSMNVLTCKTDTINNLNNIYKCGHIYHKSNVEWQKNEKKCWSLLEKENFYGLNFPILLVHFFNENSQEYIKQEYQQKIEETFEYLIESSQKNNY